MGTFSSQIRGIDLPAIYAAAQQYRVNEQQMRSQNEERQRQLDLRKLYAENAKNGGTNNNALMAMDPQGYMQFREGQQKIAAGDQQRTINNQQLANNAAVAQQRRQDQAIQNSVAVGNAFRFVEKSPDKPGTYRSVVPQLRAMGVLSEDAPDEYSAPYVGAMIEQSNAAHQVHEARSEKTPIQKDFDQVSAERAAHNMVPISFEDYQRQMAKAGATSIVNDMGNGNLTPAGRTKTEEDMRTAAGMLNSIHTLQSINPEPMLTMEGRARIEALRKLAKSSTAQKVVRLNDEDKQLLAQAGQFDNVIDMLGTAARKDALGTGQSATELKNSIMMVVSREQDPITFPSVLQSVADKTEFMLSVDRQLQSDGVPRDSERYNAMMDQAVKARDAARARQQSQPGAPQMQGAGGTPQQQQEGTASVPPDIQAGTQQPPALQPAQATASRPSGLDNIKTPSTEGIANDPTVAIVRATNFAAAMMAAQNPDGSRKFSDAQIHDALVEKGYALPAKKATSLPAKKANPQ